MSVTFSTERPRRLSGALAVLLTAAAVVGLLVVVHAGVPDAWWPKTGKAFSTTPAPQAPAQPPAGPEQAAPTTTPQPDPTRTSGDDPCDLIVGPAKDYCRKAPAGAEDRTNGLSTAGVLLLSPALIGIILIRRMHRGRA